MGKTYNPAMATFTFEIAFGKLSIGVTSNYYMDGYFVFNNLVKNILIYQMPENRLENTFNFSLGGDKGHAFSGSVFMSSAETKENAPITIGAAPSKTEITEKGASLSYSYSF